MQSSRPSAAVHPFRYHSFPWSLCFTSSADTLESFEGDDLDDVLTFDSFFASEAVVEEVGLALALPAGRL